MLLKIEQFAGAVEALSARLLDPKYATLAVNCRTGRSMLEPMSGLQAVSTLPQAAGTIFRYTPDTWFTFTQDVDLARTPVAYDTTDRVVYTGTGYPKQTRNDIALGGAIQPNGHYRLGVPAPATAPVVSSVGTPDPDQAGLEQTVYYVYCLVTAWGEEGPPSDPSLPVDITDGQEVNLTFGAVPSGAYNFGTGAVKRIYRSNSGSQSTEFQFLADILASATTYQDTTPADALGEVIPSVTWAPPPEGLIGIRTLPSGALVGFQGNTLLYSEPYLPHAWANYYPLKDKIVAIEVTSTGVLVGTTDKPVSAEGLDPSAVNIVELDERQACVSKRSMVDMGEYAIYASPDGLVGLQNGSASVLTQGMFTRGQWQRFVPTSIKAFRWEGKYVGFYTGGAFIFDPTDLAGGFLELTGVAATAGYYDPADDTLFVANETALSRFGRGSDLSYTWRSKIFQLPEPSSLAAIQVIADSYPVNVKVIKDENVAGAVTYSVASAKPERLEPGRAGAWQVEITGTKTVHQVLLASSMMEIARG